MSSPDFTGERFIPGQGGAQIAYEHLHRYRFALRWAAGQDVLDVAAGVGYGAGLLATTARRVWAVDLDAASVLYARQTYPAGNLLFLQGDATSLPVRSDSADLVIALEVLEHVENQEGLVAELARVVQRGGTVLISTPNKASYSDARNYHNPFHTREFYREEFLALLHCHFGSIQLVHQHVRAGSLILNEEATAGDAEVIAESVGGEPALDATYFLALCRIGDRLPTIPAGSAYLDTGDGFLREWEQRLQAAGIELERLNQEIEQLGAWSRELQDKLAARDQAILEFQEELARLRKELDERGRWALTLQAEIAARDASLEQVNEEHSLLRKEFDERGRWAHQLDQEIAARDARIKSAQEHLAQIEGRRMYRILRRLGLLPE
jgi:SAM-dependent methyltransferase